MKTIRLDDRTVLAMAQIAMQVYEIAIDVDNPRSIQAGVKALFERMQADAIPDSEPIAQLEAIAEDMARLHRRMVKEAYPQMRTAA